MSRNSHHLTSSAASLREASLPSHPCSFAAQLSLGTTQLWSVLSCLAGEGRGELCSHLCLTLPKMLSWLPHWWEGGGRTGTLRPKLQSLPRRIQKAYLPYLNGRNRRCKGAHTPSSHRFSLVSLQAMGFYPLMALAAQYSHLGSFQSLTLVFQELLYFPFRGNTCNTGDTATFGCWGTCLLQYLMGHTQEHGSVC